MDEKDLDKEDIKEEESKEAADTKVEAEQETKEEKEETASSNSEAEDLKASLVRLQADFNNFRTRAEKDKSQLRKFTIASFIEKLLPVLDNFDRALALETDDKKFLEGVKLIQKDLLAVLEKEGLKEIESTGKTFDPNFHNAIMTEESEENDNLVIETFQKGYMLDDKVIRPSMVKVSK